MFFFDETFATLSYSERKKTCYEYYDNYQERLGILNSGVDFCDMSAEVCMQRLNALELDTMLPCGADYLYEIHAFIIIQIENTYDNVSILDAIFNADLIREKEIASTPCDLLAKFYAMKTGELAQAKILRAQLQAQTNPLQHDEIVFLNMNVLNIPLLIMQLEIFFDFATQTTCDLNKPSYTKLNAMCATVQSESNAEVAAFLKSGIKLENCEDFFNALPNVEFKPPSAALEKIADQIVVSIADGTISEISVDVLKNLDLDEERFAVVLGEKGQALTTDLSKMGIDKNKVNAGIFEKSYQQSKPNISSFFQNEIPPENVDVYRNVINEHIDDRMAFSTINTGAELLVWLQKSQTNFVNYVAAPRQDQITNSKNTFLKFLFLMKRNAKFSDLDQALKKRVQLILERTITADDTMKIDDIKKLQEFYLRTTFNVAERQILEFIFSSGTNVFATIMLFSFDFQTINATVRSNGGIRNRASNSNSNSNSGAARQSRAANNNSSGGTATNSDASAEYTKILNTFPRGGGATAAQNFAAIRAFVPEARAWIMNYLNAMPLYCAPLSEIKQIATMILHIVESNYATLQLAARDGGMESDGTERSENDGGIERIQGIEDIKFLVTVSVWCNPELANKYVTRYVSQNLQNLVAGVEPTFAPETLAEFFRTIFGENSKTFENLCTIKQSIKLFGASAELTCLQFAHILFLTVSVKATRPPLVTLGVEASGFANNLFNYLYTHWDEKLALFPLQHTKIAQVTVNKLDTTKTANKVILHKVELLAKVANVVRKYTAFFWPQTWGEPRSIFGTLVAQTQTFAKKQPNVWTRLEIKSQANNIVSIVDTKEPMDLFAGAAAQKHKSASPDVLERVNDAKRAKPSVN